MIKLPKVNIMPNLKQNKIAKAQSRQRTTLEELLFSVLCIFRVFFVKTIGP
jgi:hypothetical protein